MSPFIFLFLNLCILAYAILAGVFLAFSDFIMRALSNVDSSGGVEAMQVINREVFRWIFMVLLIGMTPVSLMIALYGGISIGGHPGTLMMLAGAVYVIGCFGVTVFFNVPMNEALAEMEPTADTTRNYWMNTYLPRWTRWNTARVVACTASAALMLIALMWLVQTQARLG